MRISLRRLREPTGETVGNTPVLLDQGSAIGNNLHAAARPEEKEPTPSQSHAGLEPFVQAEDYGPY